MAEHIWTVLCQKTLTDSKTGIISLIDVVEKFVLDPGSKQAIANAKLDGKDGIVFSTQMQLVSSWVRSDLTKAESATVRVSFTNQEGKVKFSRESPLPMVDGQAQRLTVNIDHIAISGPGRHWFGVELKLNSNKWQFAARVPVEIEIPETT